MTSVAKVNYRGAAAPKKDIISVTIWIDPTRVDTKKNDPARANTI